MYIPIEYMDIKYIYSDTYYIFDNMADYVSILLTVLYGAGAAAFAALIGYAKARYKAGRASEPFEASKVLYTVMLGSILGGIAAYYGVDLVGAEGIVESFIGMAALVYFIDVASKAMARYITSKF